MSKAAENSAASWPCLQIPTFNWNHEWAEIAGRGHAVLSGKPYLTRSLDGQYPKMSGWTRLVIAIITIIGIALVVASVFFISALRRKGISQKIITHLNEHFTKLELQVYGFTTVSLGALLFLVGMGSYRYLSKRVGQPKPKSACNFPFNGEHQLPSPDLPPGFSPGNWTACHGIQMFIEPNDLPVKQFGLCYKTPCRGGWDRPYFFVVNCGSHYTLSSGLNEQEAILMAQVLQDKFSYTFKQKGNGALHTAIYDFLSEKAPDDNPLKKVNIAQKTVWVASLENGKMVEQPLVSVLTEGTYLLSRSWEDISHPDYAQDIGFVSVTMNIGNQWYSRLIFKEEGVKFEVTVRKVLAELPKGLSPAKLAVSSWPGWTNELEGAAKAYGETHHFGRARN